MRASGTKPEIGPASLAHLPEALPDRPTSPINTWSAAKCIAAIETINEGVFSFAKQLVDTDCGPEVKRATGAIIVASLRFAELMYVRLEQEGKQ